MLRCECYGTSITVVLHIRHRPSVRPWALDIDYRRAHAGRLRLCVHAVLVVLHMRHRPSVRLWALDINRCDLVGSQRAKMVPVF